MHSRVRGVVVLVLAAGCTLPAASVLAGGFAVSDQGARGMGMGGAHVARASDPSAIYYNVAGLAFIKQPELTLGGTLVVSAFKFTGEEPFPGPTAEEEQKLNPRFPPTLYFAHPIGERIVVGFGYQRPFVLSSSWATPDAFSGRFIAQETSFVCQTASPSIGLKLADRLAVGAALDVHLGKLKVERRLPVVNPFTLRRTDAAAFSIESDTATKLGFRLGLLARPSDRLALGMAYRSGASLDLSGTGTVARLATGSAQLDNALAATLPAAPVPFATTLALPAAFVGGLAYTWNEWVFAAEVELDRWSVTGSVALDFEGWPDLRTVLLRNFEDSHALRGGIERRLNHLWAIRAGYYYDTTPAPIESLSPAFADATRQGVVLGASLTQGPWRVDVAPGVVFYKQRDTLGANPEGYDGIYKNTALVLGVSIGRVF